MASRIMVVTNDLRVSAPRMRLRRLTWPTKSLAGGEHHLHEELGLPGREHGGSLLCQLDREITPANLENADDDSSGTSQFAVPSNCGKLLHHGHARLLHEGLELARLGICNLSLATLYHCARRLAAVRILPGWPGDTSAGHVPLSKIHVFSFGMVSASSSWSSMGTTRSCPTNLESKASIWSPNSMKVAHGHW